VRDRLCVINPKLQQQWKSHRSSNSVESFRWNSIPISRHSVTRRNPAVISPPIPIIKCVKVVSKSYWRLKPAVLLSTHLWSRLQPILVMDSDIMFKMVDCFTLAGLEPSCVSLSPCFGSIYTSRRDSIQPRHLLAILLWRLYIRFGGSLSVITESSVRGRGESLSVLFPGQSGSVGTHVYIRGVITSPPSIADFH